MYLTLASVVMEIQNDEVCRRFCKPFYARMLWSSRIHICDLLKHDTLLRESLQLHWVVSGDRNLTVTWRCEQ